MSPPNLASLKKRKPSFRPASNRKAQKAAIQADEALNAVEDECDDTATRLTESLPMTSLQLIKSKESNLEPLEDAEEDLPAIFKQKLKARPRKRKTTVLAVGASRGADAVSTALVVAAHGNQNEGVKNVSTATTSPSKSLTAVAAAHQSPASPDDGTKKEHLPVLSNQHVPHELVPPVIPENTTGKPSLSSFCSPFPKPKQRRGGQTAEATTALAVAAKPPTEEPVVPDATATQRPQHAGPVVQIVNGEIVLQESSMVFQGSGAGNDPGDNMTVVEEEAEMAVVGATYTSFATGRRARPKTSHWTVEETQLFYEALRQVGLDFGTMEAYFESTGDPSIRKRLRRQLKRKYQAEYTKNPALIEKALQPTGRVDIDLSVFQLTEESIKEMQAEQEKEKSNMALKAEAAAGTVKADDDGVLEELNLLDKDGVAKNATAPRKKGIQHGRKEFLWPEASAESGDNDGTFDDPMFSEGQDATTAAEGEEEVPALALVHGVTSNASKKKRPKFRSTPGKRVAKANQRELSMP